MAKSMARAAMWSRPANLLRGYIIRIIYGSLAILSMWMMLRFDKSCRGERPFVAPSTSPNLHASEIATDTSYLDATLVVLVIANEDPIYKMNWAVWNQLLHQNANVQVYFLVSDMDLPEEHGDIYIDESTHRIAVRTAESMVPGILVKTMEALAALMDDKRRTFTHILRTNLSSMWHWKRLFAAIAQLNDSGEATAAGVLFKSQADAPGLTVSGAGLLMNREAIQVLLSCGGSLDYAMYDDVAIGLVLHANNVRMLNLGRCDFTSGTMPPGPVDTDATCFHWRVKNANDRDFYDGYILSRLYIELYGGL